MSDDKPWTDYDRLLDLEEEKDTYREMADELGCHPNTVRKHLDRAHEERGIATEDDEKPVRGPKMCVRCEENETPGGEKTGNTLCVSCIDEARADD